VFTLGFFVTYTEWVEEEEDGQEEARGEEVGAG